MANDRGLKCPHVLNRSNLKNYILLNTFENILYFITFHNNNYNFDLC